MRFERFSFRFAEEILNSKLALKNEIETTILGLRLDLGSTLRPHQQIVNSFLQRGWRPEKSVSKDFKMRHDLIKGRVAVEIETSHVIHTYKDYLKFLSSFNEGKIDLGILIVYTQGFIKKYNLPHAKPSLRKVKKDLQFFRLIIPVPIYVIGLDD